MKSEYKKIILLVFLISAVYLSYNITMFVNKLNNSRDLINTAVKFENVNNNLDRTILVLGDSTGFGVGAKDNKNSIAGRLFAYTGATYLENKSVSGAKIIDLPKQISSQNKNLNLKSYDIILIQIGGNDITRFKSVDEGETNFRDFLNTLPEHKQLIVMSVGNVGSATLFPKFIRYFHTKLTLKYHAMFTRVLANIPEAKYINLYDPPAQDLFQEFPEKYLASDGFHPSDAGYGLWFEKLIEQIK